MYIKKNCITLVFLVIVSLFTLVNTAGNVGATNGDYYTVIGGVTNNKSPIISGSMPNCADLAVSFYGDTSDDAEAVLFSQFDSGFSVGSGNWFLNLAAAGVTLTNGYHDIFLASKCGFSTYSTSPYADYFFDELYVVPAGCNSNCDAVHRFYNYRLGVHFYTANESEKRQVLKLSDTYRYEGIASFARHTQEANTVPVHRFYNFKQGVHFYTSNQSEATNVNYTASHTYRYEGVSSYNVENK